MCDAKPNSTMTVKTSNRKATGATYQGINAEGNPSYTFQSEVDPTITDDTKRDEYGLAPKKKPGTDLTDKALRDARTNEALRLRARRGRKASFLQSELDWTDQKMPGFKQTTQDGVGGSWDL